MDITKVSTRTLNQNLSSYSRQLGSSSEDVRNRAIDKIQAIEAELARRASRKGHRGKTAGYVLTATGQFEHIASKEREGFTKCGVAIDPDREPGDAPWWHCLHCGS